MDAPSVNVCFSDHVVYGIALTHAKQMSDASVNGKRVGQREMRGCITYLILATGKLLLTVCYCCGFKDLLALDDKFTIPTTGNGADSESLIQTISLAVLQEETISLAPVRRTSPFCS